MSSDSERGLGGDPFVEKYGFDPPPEWSDLSGYEPLLDLIVSDGIHLIPGDFVEIGVLLGGGTYKLSKLLERLAPSKRLYAIDIFDPDTDHTQCSSGLSMAEIYREKLADRNQRDVYDEITGGCANLVTLVGDSMHIDLPCEAVAFSYIDGSHEAEHVRGDFGLIWERLSPGGVVVFDDYGHDIPDVTRVVHELIGEHARQIQRVRTIGLKAIALEKMR